MKDFLKAQINLARDSSWLSQPRNFQQDWAKKLNALTLITVLSFIACPVVYADEQPVLLPRCGQTAFGLCGFIDANIWMQNSRAVFIIEPKFEAAQEFSEGLAAIRIEGKFGYVNPSGEVVIEPQFDQAGKFNQGLAVAGDINAVGIINRSGDYVVKPAFARALIFNDQIILGVPSRNSERAWSKSIDFSIPGAGIYNITSGWFTGHSIQDAGIYHITDGWLTEQKYHFTRFDKAKSGLIWAQVPGGKPGTFDDLYGLMKVDGSWLIEPQYSFAIELKNGRAPVRKRINGKTVSGAVDGTGKEVVPFEFDYLTHWDEGFLLAGEDDYSKRKFGLVNQDGKLLAGRYFDKIERPKNYLGPDHPEQDYFYVKDGEKWKTLLTDGTLLADQRIGNVFLDCEQYQIRYGVKGYDLKPKDLALPTVWFDKPLFSSTNQKCDPPPTLVRGGAYAAITKNGAIFGGFHENSKGFFGTHRWVNVDGKWGLVDANGEFVVGPIYHSISNEGGYQTNQDLPSTKADTTYKVSISDEIYRLRFINGNYIQEPFTERKEDRSNMLSCRGGLKLKSEDGLWGIIDKNGANIIPAKHRAISCFNSGLTWVPNDALRKWCPLDSKGKPRSAPACTDTYYPIWASHSSPEELHEDPYESNVLWVRAWLDYGAGRRDQKPELVPW